MFSLNNVPLQIERFPDMTPRLNIVTDTSSVTIKWIYEKDEEMILQLIVRHLRERLGVTYIALHMPYVPHARMDRTKESQEVFTLKYFCEFINSMHFDKVIVRDAHSNVALALLKNVVAEPVDNLIKRLVSMLSVDIIFYPDEGSCKRYSELFEFPYIFGIKNRDWRTGKIKDLMIPMPDSLPELFNVLIVDDISSYGGTFLHSARKLKELGAGKIYLYVTHCENSILKGELINSNLLEGIYTTQSIFTESHPLIQVMGLQYVS